MTHDSVEIRKIAHFVPVPMNYFVEPTAEEREQWRLADERRRAEAARLLYRHYELLHTHSYSPVLVALLEAHSPHEGTRELECHACPANVDYEQGEEPASWPCTTWTVISEKSGGAA